MARTSFFSAIQALISFSCKKTTLSMKDVHRKSSCCLFRQRQGQAGGIITGTKWELPAGSCYGEVAEFIVQRSTGQTLQLTDQCSTAQAVPARVNCGVDLWLIDVWWSPGQDHHHPLLDPHTVFPSQWYCKLQIILITYRLLKPKVQGQTEHMWPVQDHRFLKHNIFHKLPIR